MRISKSSIVAAAVVAGLATATTTATTGSAQAGTGSKSTSVLSKNTTYGLSSDGTQLSVFVSSLPSVTAKLGTIKGLTGDTKLIGIDVRIQDGKLYGVGDQGGIYTIDRKAKATKVSQLTVALTGTQFGVDFNPAADRLRVVSDTGQNLRHNVNPEGTTLVDGTLSYAAPAAAAGVTAVAYTNNDLSANTATSLYDIDTTLNQLSQQVPANAGTLVQVGVLGLDATSVAGFDIDSKLSEGVTVRNDAYAVLRTKKSPKPVLYKIDLLTGGLSKVGTFRTDVADIAVVQG